MGNFALLLQGFADVITPYNIFVTLIGIVTGVIIGALPGFGPSSGVALLLPMVYGMDDIPAMIMLCGIYYGAMFGGAITSILINTPGDSAAVMTSMDGYPMAKKGRAGSALGISTLSSFVGGTFGTLALTFIAPIIARYALAFGPPEYFGLMVLGLTTLACMTGKNRLKGFVMALIGLLLATVGADIMVGTPRFVFGISALWSGIDFIPVVMGFFGFSEILINCEQDLEIKLQEAKITFRDALPSKEDLKACTSTVARGSVLGFFIGVLPGAGATIASFISYSTAKKLSKHPDEFGTGIPEGVAAPESANNAAAAGALVPLLTLGVPGSGTTAVMLGALTMLGMHAGPTLFTAHADFVYALVASLYVANVLLLFVNMFGIPAFASILKIPYKILMPCIMIFLIIGCYSLELRMSNVWIMIFFGVVGYILKKIDYPGAPLILSLVLGILTEKNLRQSLTLSHGSWTIFLQSPICCLLLIVSVLFVAWPLIRGCFSKKKPASEKQS